MFSNLHPEAQKRVLPIFEVFQHEFTKIRQTENYDVGDITMVDSGDDDI